MAGEAARSPAVLAGVRVPRAAGYRGIRVEGGLLRGPDRHPRAVHTTYAGVGVVNLDLVPREGGGVRRFFESVADPLRHRIPVAVAEGAEFWDFGTRERYLRSLLGLAEGRGGAMRDLLVGNAALDPGELGRHSYRGPDGVLNFCGEGDASRFGEGSVLVAPPVGEWRGPGLYGLGMFDPVGGPE